MLVLAAAAAGVLLIWEIHRPGPTSQTTSFVVERGAGAMAIGRKLQTEGHVRHALVFRAASVLYTSDALKAGEYAVDPRDSLRTIIERIESGRMLQFPVTVPEGLTSAMIVEIVQQHPHLAGEITETPGEGTLLPETYMAPRNADRADLIARMRADQQALIEDLWPKRQADLPFDTIEEALILASIVEKETGVALERPLVASVFVNRLRRGMRLESDPTIIYGLTQGRPLGRGIRRSEIDRTTPYNTYRIDGLPPTPIANPGRDAIAAVLDPPESDYLFFVADGTGGHVFAATNAEHERNVAAWRAIERERTAAAGGP
jgi:UPF0755 protein